MVPRRCCWDFLWILPRLPFQSHVPQCEIYIKEHGIEKEVEAKIKELYKDKGVERPKYHGKLPEGNNGLGLMLLGVTGDQVLPIAIYNEIKAKTISQVRGTVQADILKEDQAQNTCIFSTEFALRLMGDRCPFRGTTSPKLVQTPSHNWHWPYPMDLLMWSITFHEAWTSTSLDRIYPSFSQMALTRNMR